MIGFVDTLFVSTRRLVDTSGQERKKYRRWPIEEKQRIVLETLEAGTSVFQVAQRYAVNPNMVFSWRKLYREGRLKKDVQPTGLLPVKVSDERLIEAAHIQHQILQAFLGTMEIQLPKGKLQITGRVDSLTLRTAIECLVS
jgi:transposase